MYIKAPREMKSQILAWDNMKSHSQMPSNATKLNLMDLPTELLQEILKRVPAKSVCGIIRCVSKMLLSTVDSPSFVKLHSKFVFDPDSHLPPSPPQSILHYHRIRYLCPTSNGRILSTFHSLHYDSKNAQGAPQLNPRLILESPADYTPQFVFCNLFCIKNRYSLALGFLINPLRGEVLRLPSCESIAEQVYGPSSKVAEEGYWTGMGFDSITNTYKILPVTQIRVPRRSESCYVFLVLELGTSEWRQLVTHSHPKMDQFLRSKNICAHGDMHWLVCHKRPGIRGHVHILSFDFKKEEFCFVRNPYILRHINRLHLIVFRGSMAIVDSASGTNIEIWMMKDYSKKQWKLDYSININMLELVPEFKFTRDICCEWEHGILFIDQPATITLCLDLRGPAVTKSFLRCPTEPCDWETRQIMSHEGSLMSLKSYANLLEAEEPATYSSLSEGEESGKNFFYLKAAQRD